MKNKIIIGVDLGGTKIMTGAMSLGGQVLGTPISVATIGTDPKEMILKRITDSIAQVIAQQNIEKDNILGIGIGATGPLDIQNGIILECPQLPTMQFYPLLDNIEKHFDIPTYMNNDANCLIYGETIFGVAAKRNNIVGFTLGTGIGCAIVMNGKIVNGATGTAGEIWISPYKDKTIEDYTCGQAVSDMYKMITGEERSALELHELAKQGQESALEAWKTYGEHLAVAIAWAVNLLDPEVVVLGGSVASAHSFFLPTTKEKLAKHICPEPFEHLNIEIAALGSYAGFIGAASLVLENPRGVQMLTSELN